MKALVTGGSGFIGSTLIEALAARGVEVDVLMRKTSSEKNLRGLKYRRVEGDIADPESLRRALDPARGIDGVFHLAGLTAARDRGEYFRANAEGTGNLARAVEESNRQAGGGGVRRFVYVSSLAAGGSSDSRGGRSESDVDRPLSVYGESKRAGETELLKHATNFVPVILRPPLVYGPKDTATLLLVKTVAKRVIPKFPSKTGDGEKWYSVIHSRDLVEAIVALGLAPSVGSGEVFYVSSGEEISSSKLLGTMAASLGVRTWKVPVPRTALHVLAAAGDCMARLRGKPSLVNSDKISEVLVDYWTCSNRKLMDHTGWRPKIPFEEGMREAVAWYRENGWI